jgi:hypothetical protein
MQLGRCRPPALRQVEHERRGHRVPRVGLRDPGARVGIRSRRRPADAAKDDEQDPAGPWSSKRRAGSRSVRRSGWSRRSGRVRQL